MTDNTQELDEILALHMPLDKNHQRDKANIKQAILAWHNKQIELYKKMLEDLGTEKCPHCKDFMIDTDVNICESCDYPVHEWCTGYTYDGDGEYPSESAYAICKDCWDKTNSNKLKERDDE